MDFKSQVISLSVLAILATAGCSTDQQKAAQESKAEEKNSHAMTNAVASDAKAENFAEIKFSEGSSALTENSKAALNSVVAQTALNNEIDNVIVLSWADKEFPSKSLKKLTKDQRDLADRRNKSIEEYVKTVRDIEVDTYNMAERPNALSKWINTSDNRLKNSFLAAGLSTTAESEPYPSKASHSVVLIKVKQ
jgi:hypothetical protein